MTREEKIEAIADILEVEPEEVVEAKELAGYEAWDSVAILSVISLLIDEFGKFPHADEIKQYDTVLDLMNAMEKE